MFSHAKQFVDSVELNSILITHKIIRFSTFESPQFERSFLFVCLVEYIRLSRPCMNHFNI